MWRARSIDAAARRGALAGGGRTIAVLGCGIDVIYLPEHTRLAEQIIRAGALFSEYPPGTPSLKHQFPRRNRLISGLALGVVIVEGREDSGALITVDCALEQGREVFAVPGPLFAPTSALLHRLVQQGAKLGRRVEDILEDLRLHRAVKDAVRRAGVATPLVPHLQAFVRHTPPGRRIRYPDGPGAARTQGREDHDELHLRAEPRRKGRPEPDGRLHPG